MDRRTLVKGAAWTVPAVVLGSVAPVVAASTPPASLGEACKLPAQNTTTYYRLTVEGLTGVANVTAARVDGQSVGFTPATVDPVNNTIVLGECENANSQILFEVETSAGRFTKTFKALPCKD